MNREKLIHIAQFPHEINAADARELEELTRKFPYFSLPYSLLGHYYALHKDYRMEDNLHQAALRTFNRSWLHAYIHQTPVAHTEPVAVPSEQVAEVGLVEVEETVESEVVLEEVEISVQSEAVLAGEAEEQPEETEAIVPTQEIVSEVSEIAAEAEAHEENVPAAEPVVDDLDLLMPEFASRIIEPATSEDMELEVFEEIQEFEVSREPKTESTVLFEEKASADNWADLPDLMLVPVQEKADEEEAAPTKVAATAPILYSAGGYNIEDYFPAEPEDKAPPTDFFSWLSKPTFHHEEENSQPPTVPEENVETKMDLIDRFIKAKPSIRKPAATFFNPMESAKRSETLPDGLVTETLAGVYLKQENFAGAIRIYEKLMLKFPEKSTYFAGLIDNIKKEHQL